MRGIEYSQQLGREVDQLGHNFLTFHNHSKRHNGVIGVLARAAAIERCFGGKTEVEAIVAALMREGAQETRDGAWARATLDTLRRASPTSLKVAPLVARGGRARACRG